MTWLPHSDTFCGRTQPTKETKITKRIICSELAQIFDPPGLFAPVVIRAKIFMQQLGTEKFDWDKVLPQNLQDDWNKFRKDIQFLNNIRIPRHVFKGTIPKVKEMYVFVDASEMAYGAAVYLRAIHHNNQFIYFVLNLNLHR